MMYNFLLSVHFNFIEPGIEEEIQNMSTDDLRKLKRHRRYELMFEQLPQSLLKPALKVKNRQQQDKDRIDNKECQETQLLINDKILAGNVIFRLT